MRCLFISIGATIPLLCLARLHAFAQTATPAPADAWVLTSDSPNVDPRFAATLANGFIGEVVPALGTTVRDEDAGRYFLDGFYQGSSPHEAKVQIPRWNCLSYSDGFHLCQLGIGKVSAYQQRLDLHDGTLETRFLWTDGDRSTAIRTRTFVSRVDPHLAVVSYTVTPDFDGPVELTAGLDGRNQGNRLQESGATSDGAIWMRIDVGPPTRLQAAVVVQIDFTGAERIENSRLLPPNSRQPRPDQHVKFQAARGRSYTLTAYVAVDKAGDPQDPGPADVVAAACEKARQAATAGEETLLAAHRSAWHDYWQTEIRLEGDGPDAAHDQQVLRSCLFTLIQSARPDGMFGQDSLGFTRSGWDGAVFWDDNFYIYPVRQFLYPALAMPSLRYRANRLAAARAQAVSQDDHGASFPWQSRYDGRENSRAPYSQEYHVSGEIAWAQWLHYQLTRDTNWLRGTGWPIIREVADFIVHRATERHGRYEMLRVVSPDEYTPIIDNDVFTNAIFRRALEIAGRAATVLGESPDPHWDKVAKGIYLPFDDALGVYSEYEGYKGQRTKQASVELLLFPLELPMTGQIKRNLLEYYGVRVDKTHGPGMTASSYTIGYSELGDTDRAYESFRRAIDPYLRSPFNLYSETPTNDSTDFVTSKASTLQAVIHGFAGVRVRDDGVHFRPRLPKGWRGLTFTHLPIGGAVYDVHLNAAGEVRAELISGHPDIPLYDATDKALTW